MMGIPEVPVVLSAADDMFFSLKIESAVKLVGVKLVQASDFGQLEERLLGPAPQMIILDLNSRACAPIEAMQVTTCV
jgi:uncharacterized protein YgbK (DUF1537 family)